MTRASTCHLDLYKKKKKKKVSEKLQNLRSSNEGEINIKVEWKVWIK